MQRWEDLATVDFANFDWRETVAVLPLAAVEQHGPHLPLGTDAFICDAIVDEALARLDPAAPVLRLPTQRLGHSPEHARFPGTLSLRAETILAHWTDIGRSVAAAGVRKLVLFNSHGGQGALIDLAAQALRGECAMTIARCSYYRLALPDGLLTERERRFGVHGGQLETSLMLHITPHLVRLDRARDFPSRAEEWEAAHPGLPIEGRNRHRLARRRSQRRGRDRRCRLGVGGPGSAAATALRRAARRADRRSEAVPRPARNVNTQRKVQRPLLVSGGTGGYKLARFEEGTGRQRARSNIRRSRLRSEAPIADIANEAARDIRHGYRTHAFDHQAGRDGTQYNRADHRIP